jgi:hypothetical protein
MATDKIYTVAGTSKHPEHGYKVRFANDVMRVKNLAKSGHIDIVLVELPSSMSKLEAVKFIRTLPEFEGVAEQTAISDYLDRKDEKPAKTASVKAPAAKAPAKTKAPAKAAKVVEDEEAPF